jgi:hypothetical protein
MTAAPQLFNTPIESGVRSLCLLATAFPEAVSIDRLVVLDHVIVHTGDFGGPDSLHPPSPLRVAEPLVRRELVRRGLLLFKSRGLVCEIVCDRGLLWQAADPADPFLECFATDYNTQLRTCAHWTWKRFGAFSETDLSRYFGDHVVAAVTAEISE